MEAAETVAVVERTWKELLQIIMGNSITHSVIIIILAVIFDKILNQRLLKYISLKIQGKSEENAGRYKTLFSVFSKIITAVITFLVVIWVLQILFNINSSSLIAATGIAGAALGLGAQSLVKDSINGFFVLVEDQFGVGDYVTIEGFTGKVHSVSLRMSCIEGFDGDRMYIPNGSITKVINHSKENRKVFLDVPVSYDTDIDEALSFFEKLAPELMEKFEYITEPPQVLGVDMFDKSAINIKLMLPCVSGMQYRCKRDALKMIREKMSENNMEIPYSHITIIQKDK